MSTATMIENDQPIDVLKEQILNVRQTSKAGSTDSQADAQSPVETAEQKQERKSAERKFAFKKGDTSIEVDEDAELEFMADKRQIKLTLRELKDRAAGDVAIKNRMHQLAEEKKKVSATFKEFARIAETDPLAAMEYISEKVREDNSNFEYMSYLQKLGDQAEKLSKMDEKDRKAMDLEKKLAKANQDLSLKQREANVVLRKQEILSQYPEIGDQRFGEMVDAVLSTPEIIDDCENEEDVMDKVEYLVEETMAQTAILNAIEKIDRTHLRNDELVYAISDQLKQNPDLDENDLEEIVREVLGAPVRQQAAKQETVPAKRMEAIRTLSEKQRATIPREQLRAQGSSDFHLLAAELKKRNEDLKQNKNRSNKLLR